MRRIIFSTLLMVMLTTHTHAETLSICEEASWPPYTYEESGTPTKGIAFDLMSELTRRLNWQLDMKLYPFSRCFLMAQKGQRDGISILSKTPEREQQFVFSKPLVSTPGLLYHHIDFDVPDWRTPSDLKPYRVGMVQSHNLGDRFNTALSTGELDIIQLRDSTQGFELLHRGRLDILLLNATTGSEILKSMPELKPSIQSSTEPFWHYHYHLALNKDSALVPYMKDIDKLIDDMHRDNTIASISERYMFESSNVQKTP